MNDQQLLELTALHGTPLYVYDADLITTQYQKLTSAFSGVNARFFYACKALTNLQVLKHIRSIGCSIDCSSVNEAKLALLAGFKPGDILYTSNSIAFAEIEEAASLGIHVNIDSLSNLEKFGKKFGHDYPVGIRLRPNIMAGGNLKISTGHDKSKFGIPVEDLPKILQLVETYDLHIRNLHIHTGSDISDVSIFIKGIEVLFDIIPRFRELTSIDLGGGFKVPYKPSDAETDVSLLAARIKEALDEHPVARDLEIWFEPGKFLVSAAGTLLSTVNVLKESKSTLFAGLDSGLNHLIRPMFYDAWHEINNLSNASGAMKPYTVVGNICETDTFATDRPLPEVREGDVLAFRNAGAYGFEMSSHFNSRLKPAEILVKGGQATLIRRRETFEDLLHTQIQEM